MERWPHLQSADGWLAKGDRSQIDLAIQPFSVDYHHQDNEQGLAWRESDSKPASPCSTGLKRSGEVCNSP
jgi:hypothetical protein